MIDSRILLPGISYCGAIGAPIWERKVKGLWTEFSGTYRQDTKLQETDHGSFLDNRMYKISTELDNSIIARKTSTKRGLSSVKVRR
ncbi:hypothetical protein ACQKFM_05925 [Paenibacillus xylanexedens]|uniref:hypothetical protein n=1 Tax=Paenibacillus xylanexedens TaxID=528191 RepID=UPI003CFDDA25